MNFSSYSVPIIHVRREDKDWYAETFCVPQEQKHLPTITLYHDFDGKDLSEVVDRALADIQQLGLVLDEDIGLAPNFNDMAEVEEETLSWLHRIKDEAVARNFKDLTTRVVGGKYKIF